MTSQKTCIDCKNLLSIEDFYTTRQNGKIYHSSRCKKCELESYRTRCNASYKKRASTLFYSLKSRCKKSGLPVSITKNDIIRQYEIQNGKCYYTGNLLSWVSGNENIMSVDRKNNNLGYTPDNIALCSWQINKLKTNYSEQEFVQKCKEIHQFSENRKF